MSLQAGPEIDLTDRVEALARFVDSADGAVLDSRLAGVKSLLDRASARLRLSGEHTVAAFAGATGGGKSSLFNALARIPLSPVGRRRPTTDEVHACVWRPAGAGPLLDWLGVPSEHRFSRESPLDAEDEAGLRGLVLLDLPAVDPVGTGHRVESHRLIRLVDLLIWVVDPEKYADRAIHRRFLRDLAPLREVTVVVLNQIDRLTPSDAERCVADLHRLLESDGLGGVPVLATSAVTGAGLSELRAVLEKAAASRRAWQARLEGEMAPLVEDLAPLIGPEVRPDAISPAEVRTLTDVLIDVGDVRGSAREVQRRYARGASLLFRRRERALADQGKVAPGTPSARLADQGEPTELPRTVLTLTQRAGAGLPEPWPAAVTAAAVGRLPQLPAALRDAIVRATPPGPRRLGWRFALVFFWAGILGAVGGAAWWGIDRLLRAYDRRGLIVPEWQDWPVPLLVSGTAAVLALLVLALTRPPARRRARQAGVVAEERYREAVAEVARDQVVTPIRNVLANYSEARAALTALRGRGSPDKP